MRARTMRFWRIGMVAIGVVVLAVAGVVSISAQSPDDAAVRATVTRALELSRTLPLEASKLSAGPAVARFRDNASAEFARLYIGKILDQKVETVEWNLAAIPNNGDQAGTKQVHFDSVKVGNGSAIAKATVTVWDNWTLKGEWVANYTFDLVLRDGQWLIEKEDVTYPPGMAPG